MFLPVHISAGNCGKHLPQWVMSTHVGVLVVGVCPVASFPRKFFGRRCSMTPLTVELVEPRVEPHSSRVIGRRHCLIYILSTTVSKV